MSRTRDADFEAYVLARGRAWERYAYLLTGDRHRAQDLLQTVLLNTYRRWRRIVVIEQPDAYVRRMLTNSYLDWRRRRANTELPVEILPDIRLSPDPAAGVVDRDELQRALLVLTPHQRAVMVLRHIEGLADEEIAALLGCSVGTVRTHAARGKERFRTALFGPSSDHPAADNDEPVTAATPPSRPAAGRAAADIPSGVGATADPPKDSR